MANLNISLIARDPAMTESVAALLEKIGHAVTPLARLDAALGSLYSDPGDLIIADLSGADAAIAGLVRDVRGDSYFSIIPLIGLVRAGLLPEVQWEQLPLDDYVPLPLDELQLRSRITLAVSRIHRVFDNNPLTKLPGNTSIQRAIEKVLGQAMAVCYLDINLFKPYNDVYGFVRGDEVLRIVGRITSNTVKEVAGGGFVGHIGGDDFVFIVPLAKAETVCQEVIDRFQIIVNELFGEPEKSQGYYVAKNRQGEVQRIPLLGVAIAVVPMNYPKITHYGRVAEVAAELKKFAKMAPTSRYVIDRREN